MRADTPAKIGPLVLALAAIGVLFLSLYVGGFFNAPPVVPRPQGDCDLWIVDESPTFICRHATNEGAAVEVWKLHRNGRWQYIGPATDSNMGVNQG